MGEKISVVVPVYNAEKYIEMMLESLCSQTYQNLEILLIDDGSSDHSRDICNLWQAKEARIRLISQENKGASQARNRGIREAAGKYIMFLDADDWIEADMLEILYRLAEEYEADVANCILQEETLDKMKKIQLPVVVPKKDMKVEFYDNKKESGLALLKVWGPVCKLYRSSLIKNICFENYQVAEDLLFNTNVICSDAFEKVVTVNYPFYHYVIYPGSTMKQKFQKKYLEAMQVEVQCYEKLTAISREYADINLVGCSVSRVFEKYAQLSPEEKKQHKAEFQYCKKFAKVHKKKLLCGSNRHRKISGALKVYVPDIYLWLLSRRYQNIENK